MGVAFLSISSIYELIVQRMQHNSVHPNRIFIRRDRNEENPEENSAFKKCFSR